MHDIMRELDSGMWAEHNPASCPCHGNGWLHSDWDTLHQCPIHGRGVPHPEDEEREEEFDFTAHRRQMYKEAWVYFRDRAKMTPWDFRSAVTAHVRSTVRAATFTPTMQEWVAFAEEVADAVVTEEQEKRARAMGFSCRLEAAWAAEAQVEAEARQLGMDPDVYAPCGSPERADADSWYG